MAWLTYTATLPVPPGINQAYAAGTSARGRAVFYKRAAAKDWTDTALLSLRRQGWRTRPPTPGSRWHIQYTLRTPWRRDVDGIAKPLIDLCAEALGIDDRDLTDGGFHKERASRANEGLTVTVDVWVPESSDS